MAPFPTHHHGISFVARLVMSFSATLRRSFSSTGRTTFCQSGPSRNAAASSSTQAPSKSKKRQYTLPREKLRALISLYHQSDTFITQDNLVDKINEALVKELKPVHMGAQKLDMPTARDFYAILESRRGAPKIADASSASEDRMKHRARITNAQWSASAESKREERVIEALYGVNMSGVNGVRPGLEAVEGALEQERSVKVSDQA